MRGILQRLSRYVLEILSDGKFHSGQILAEQLNVTRTAVWKAVKQLLLHGINIQITRNRGYCVPGGFELLQKKYIEQAMTSVAIDLFNSIEIFDSLPSTNLYLLEQQNLTSGSVCIAETQTAGRGRRGRSWYSPFGASLYISILWYFDGSLTLLDGLTLAIGVALVKSLKNMGVDELGIKWPNDIYYRGCKISGILVEMVQVMEGLYKVVIGIGINVRLPIQSEQIISQPYTDIESIMKQKVSRNRLASLILNELAELLPDFQRNGFKPYQKAWSDLDFLSGKKVNVQTATVSYAGAVKGINSTGSLWVECEDGMERYFNSADVSIRRDDLS